MEFTVVDAGVGVITLLSGILAYSRGFTRELFAIAGWVAAVVAAFNLAPMLEPLIRELPAVGKYLAESCLISMIAAFTIVVAASLLILSVFTPLISGLVLHSIFGPIDRMLGFLFGVLRGLVLIAVVFLIYTNLSGVESWPPLDNAASRTIFVESSGLLERNLPDGVPEWFQDRVNDLMVNCGDELPAVTSPGADTTETGTTGSGSDNTGTTGTGTTGN